MVGLTLAVALFVTAGVPDQPDARGIDESELAAAEGDFIPVDASSGLVFGMRWRRPIVRTGFFRTVGVSFGSPAISRRAATVVVGSAEGVVHGLSLRDGKSLWRYEHDAEFGSAVTLAELPNGDEGADELAIVGSRDGTLLALDVETGELRWKATLEGDPRAPAQVEGKRVFVTTTANKLFVLSLSDGQALWTQGRSVPTGLTVHGLAKAALGPERVFVAYSDGYVEAYEKDGGSRVWSRPISLGQGEFVDADADPILLDGRLYVASYADGVFALNPSDGSTLWHREAPSVVSLAHHENMVIAASADGWVWALDRTEGDLAYRTKLSPSPISRMLVRHGLVVMSAGENGLVVLDADSGKPLQATNYGTSFGSDPSWVGRDLAVLEANGYVYVLRLEAIPAGEASQPKRG